MVMVIEPYGEILRQRAVVWPRIVVSDVFKPKLPLGAKTPSNPWTFTIQIGRFLTFPYREKMSEKSVCGFENILDAIMAREDYVENYHQRLKNTVSIVFDTNGAMGHAEMVRVFAMPEQAHEYVIRQKDVRGVAPKFDYEFRVNSKGELFVHQQYDGFVIEIFPVQQYASVMIPEIPLYAKKHVRSPA